MKQLTQTEMNELLIRHSLWLKGDVNGIQADLSRASLTGANLSRASLTGAKLIDIKNLLSPKTANN